MARIRAAAITAALASKPIPSRRASTSVASAAGNIHSKGQTKRVANSASGPDATRRNSTSSAAIPPSSSRDQCIHTPTGGWKRIMCRSNQPWPPTSARTATRRVASSVSPSESLMASQLMTPSHTAMTARISPLSAAIRHGAPKSGARTSMRSNTLGLAGTGGEGVRPGFGLAKLTVCGLPGLKPFRVQSRSGAL